MFRGRGTPCIQRGLGRGGAPPSRSPCRAASGASPSPQARSNGIRGGPFFHRALAEGSRRDAVRSARWRIGRYVCYCAAMEQKTIDRAIILLKQYRDILVASYVPIGAEGVPEPKTPEQAADPLEIAALEDLAALDAVIKEMLA